MVRGHMQKRLYRATGTYISTLQMKRLAESYREAMGEDTNYRFHRKTPLLLGICVIVWIFANSWRF